MKKFFGLFLAIACLLPLSCKKGGENEPGGETAKAVLGVQVKDAIAVYEVPQNQSVNLELAVVADPTSAEPYTVSVAAKPALVAGYNTKNGTTYQMLPAEAFTLTGSPVVLPRYGAKSSSFNVRLKGAGCEPDQVYVLPVAVDAVQGGTNFDAPDDKAAYILFKMIPTDEEGDGSEAKPFVIKDVESFLKMDALLQDEATTCFKLDADLDFKDVVFTEENPWKPVNAASAKDETAESAARHRRIVFDGNGHKISNFKADGPIFGILCGSISDLTIDGFVIDSDYEDAATLVGVAGSSDLPENFVIKNVKVTNSRVVSLQDRAGGLVSRIRNGLVENCSTDCSVEANTRAGGIVGYMGRGTINNSSAAGNIKVVTYMAGGLVGWAGEVTVTGCHASGNIVSEGGNYVRGGGLIGQIEGNSTIKKCYATGNVEGQGHMGGGLIGVITSKELDKDQKIYENVDVTVSECYATGNVTLPHGDTGNWAHAGGLIGTITASPESTVSISNCYSSGAVAARRYSGGFVGSAYDKVRACKKLTISNSYTTSDITGIVLDDRCGLVLGLNDGANAETPNVIECSGFVAWNTSERPFSYQEMVPMDNSYYGTDGTVSQQAQKLGWDTSVWDFSGNEPKLKLN